MHHGRSFLWCASTSMIGGIISSHFEGGLPRRRHQNSPSFSSVTIGWWLLLRPKGPTLPRFRSWTKHPTRYNERTPDKRTNVTRDAMILRALSKAQRREYTRWAQAQTQRTQMIIGSRHYTPRIESLHCRFSGHVFHSIASALGHWAWCSFSSARLVRLYFLLFFSFVNVAWDGNDTKVFGRIFSAFSFSGTPFSSLSNDAIWDSLFCLFLLYSKFHYSSLYYRSKSPAQAAKQSQATECKNLVFIVF